MLVRPHFEMRCDDRIHSEAMAQSQGQGCPASCVSRSSTFVRARTRRRTAHDCDTERLGPQGIAPSRLTEAPPGPTKSTGVATLAQDRPGGYRARTAQPGL